MNGLLNEMQSAMALAAMLGVVFAGIRILVDPEVLLTLSHRLAEKMGRVQFPWSLERPVNFDPFPSRHAHRSARLLGLVVTLIGMAGTLARLW